KSHYTQAVGLWPQLQWRTGLLSYFCQAHFFGHGCPKRKKPPASRWLSAASMKPGGPDPVPDPALPAAGMVHSLFRASLVLDHGFRVERFPVVPDLEVDARALVAGFRAFAR